MFTAAARFDKDDAAVFVLGFNSVAGAVCVVFTVAARFDKDDAACVCNDVVADEFNVAAGVCNGVVADEFNVDAGAAA